MRLTLIRCNYYATPCFNSRTLGRVRLFLTLIKCTPYGFNSRTLGRVRPLSSVTFICASMFQFTHPGKGATSSSIRQRSIFLWFQFTHPGKGATIVLWGHYQALWSFNSRTLGRVRPDMGEVSGCAGVFQFTHPGKGATPHSSPQPSPS